MSWNARGPFRATEYPGGGVMLSEEGQTDPCRQYVFPELRILFILLMMLFLPDMQEV